jgi:hypothetical protein
VRLRTARDELAATLRHLRGNLELARRQEVG